MVAEAETAAGPDVDLASSLAEALEVDPALADPAPVEIPEPPVARPMEEVLADALAQEPALETPEPVIETIAAAEPEAPAVGESALDDVMATLEQELSAANPAPLDLPTEELPPEAVEAELPAGSVESEDSTGDDVSDLVQGVLDDAVDASAPADPTGDRSAEAGIDLPGELDQVLSEATAEATPAAADVVLESAENLDTSPADTEAKPDEAYESALSRLNALIERASQRMKNDDVGTGS
jgi:hypothetical protein